MNKPLPEPSPETIEKVKSLLKRIKRAKGMDHDAEEELAAMGIEGALAVGKTLESRIASTRRIIKRIVIFIPVIFAIVLTAFTVMAVTIILHLPIPIMKFVSDVLIVFMIGFFVWCISGLRLRDFHSAETEAKALLRNRDKRILSFLHSIPVGEPALKNEIHNTVMELLPTLEADDACLLTSGFRRQFVETLALCDKPLYRGKVTGELEDYVVAILEAYQKVGDFASRPVIERLAKSGHNPRIKQAAQECLPFLPERDDDLRNTLLQPSMKPGSAPEELLRASISASQTEPSQLLRAVQGTQSPALTEQEPEQRQTL